ncbi:response regulator [Mycoplasmatota bacterium]|nr:response regulator [Mycoplasmatota bacterium]
MENILIVDDTKTNALLLEFMLSDFNVKSVYDSKKALKSINDNKPDILLLDIVMPGYSGYDLLKEIKNDSNLNDIRVIVVSGLDNVDAKVKAFELGADEYFQKPVNSKRLLKVIRNYDKLVH